MEKEIIIKIQDFPFSQYFFRLIILLWIGYALFMYTVNPYFFLFSIIFAVTILLIIAEKTIIAKNDSIEIINSRWLRFLNEKVTYKYSEISTIRYEEKNFEHNQFFLILFFNFIFSTPSVGSNRMLHKNVNIFIELKDHKQICIPKIGSKVKMKKLVDLVKLKI